MYLSHRVSQAWEHANALRASAERGRHVLALGDFNSEPGSLVHSIVEHHGQMLDVWGVSPKNGSNPANDGSSSQGSSTNLWSDAERSLVSTGVTCDSPLNTWSAGKKTPTQLQRSTGHRLDYVFFRNAEGTSKSTRLSAKSAKVVLTEAAPGLNVSYSDHFGVLGSFEILNADTQMDPEQEASAKRPQLSNDTFESISTLYTAAHRASRTTSRSLALLSISAGFILVPLLAVAGALTPGPRPVNVVYIVVGALAGAAAWTFFLVSFLAGRSERNGLVQAHESIQTFKMALAR